MMVVGFSAGFLFMQSLLSKGSESLMGPIFHQHMIEIHYALFDFFADFKRPLLVAGVVLGVFGTGLVTQFAYRRMTCGQCSNSINLKGKTVIVTGASQGLGYETAKALAKHGARVILACRNMSRGTPALSQLQAEIPNADLVLKLLDTSSLASVMNFASEIHQEERRVHVLINNAGITASKKAFTNDRLEVVMATNVVGPFLLTNLLMEKLKLSQPTRIINISDNLLRFAQFELETLNTRPGSISGPNAAMPYFVSKFVIALWTKELSKRFRDAGVTAYCVHPGVVWTKAHNDLLAHAPLPLKPLAYAVTWILNATHIYKTPEEGAQTAIYCATEPGVEQFTGRYFSDCSVRPDPESIAAVPEEFSERLWKELDKLAHVYDTPSPSLRANWQMGSQDLDAALKNGCPARSTPIKSTARASILYVPPNVPPGAIVGMTPRSIQPTNGHAGTGRGAGSTPRRTPRPSSRIPPGSTQSQTILESSQTDTATTRAASEPRDHHDNHRPSNANHVLKPPTIMVEGRVVERF